MLFALLLAQALARAHILLTPQSEIPEKWRAKALGQIHTSSMDEGISSCYFRDDDFCHIEDDATPGE